MLLVLILLVFCEREKVDVRVGIWFEKLEDWYFLFYLFNL